MTSSSAEEPLTGNPLENPYVGPRAFREGETLYARDQEKRDLADLLTAQRIVLLHSPSGAGKTSLIQAGLAPLLRKRKFAPTPALRVNTPSPVNGKPQNRYVYSVAFYLLGGKRKPKELLDMEMKDVLQEVITESPGQTPLLILDQFEEILLLDPTDLEGQTTFFQQLGDALASTQAWALLSMREDYMGGLDGFSDYVPGHLAATFRLNFLGHEGAKEAIQGPAKKREVAFADKAAQALIKKLAVRIIQTVHGEKKVTAPYVHPFQLQVVCSALWYAVHKAKANDFRDITSDDVKRHADIDRAFQDYYAGVIEWVAERTEADQGILRRWFETELITPQGFRRQTLTGPASEKVEPREILHELERAYLIRSDTRAESTWYELSHDQLIRPIRADNKDWERPRLHPWQVLAREWEGNRHPSRLIDGYDLYTARRQASSMSNITHAEKDFLSESERAEGQRGLIRGMRAKLILLYAVGVIEALVIAALVVLYFLL